jgi:hypothetical protein
LLVNPHHIVHRVCAHFAIPPSAALAVAGGAIGMGAVLESELFPAPITASFHSALCAEEVDRLEWSVAGITQPLHELQDKQMRRLGQLGLNGLLEQIERVELDRNAFFGGATVRNPADEASFDLKIAALRNLLRPTLIVENASPGHLYEAVISNGGSGLFLLDNDGTLAALLAAVKKGPADLQLLACAWQGKTPVNSFLRHARKGPVVRPAVSCLLLLRPQTMARLLCSDDPAIREFTDQLVLSASPRNRRQQDSAKGVPGSWSALIARLARLRHASTPRRIRLSRGAAQALAEYVDQIGQIRPTGRLLKNAPLLSAKNALIFELCDADPVREVSTETMRQAIELSGSFLRESGEIASRCVKAQKVKELDDEVARMYEKVRKLEGEEHVPVSVSKLRRSYDRQDKAIHEPVLEQLLRSGKVRQREDGLLESGGEADEREPIDPHHDRRTAD